MALGVFLRSVPSPEEPRWKSLRRIQREEIQIAFRTSCNSRPRHRTSYLPCLPAPALESSTTLRFRLPWAVKMIPKMPHLGLWVTFLQRYTSVQLRRRMLAAQHIQGQRCRVSLQKMWRPRLWLDCRVGGKRHLETTHQYRQDVKECCWVLYLSRLSVCSSNRPGIIIPPWTVPRECNKSTAFANCPANLRARGARRRLVPATWPGESDSWEMLGPPTWDT